MSDNWTGERVVPGKTPERLYLQHLARYETITGDCLGKIVLDVPCGTGYGSAHLAEHGAKMVIGLDVSEVAIAYAREHYYKRQPQTLAYHVVDMTENLMKWSPAVDVVVCFEGIEHVTLSQGMEALRRMAQVCRPGGKLFLSTPNKERSLSSDKYHKQEYALDELLKLIEARGEWEVGEVTGQYRKGGPDMVQLMVGVDPDFYFVEALRKDR